jgi:FkbM family methyltransferase
VAVVVDQRRENADTTPYDKIDLSERRLAELGFSPLPADWRWLCGDLCYALAADARPEFAAYALLESDVFLPETSASPLVEALCTHPAEAIAARLGPSHGRRKFSQGLTRLGLDSNWGCIFPVTRASAEVVAEMGKLRRDHLNIAPKERINDEAILAGAVQRRGFMFERLEVVVPELVSEGTFDTNPPFLFEALLDRPDERRIHHPAVPFETVMERLRTGDKAYSRRRLRHVLRDAPPQMTKAIRRVMRDSGTTGRMHRRPELIRMNELVAALKPERRLRVADVGANPLIQGEVSYRRLLDQGHAEIVGFEPQAEALAALNAKKSESEQYLPYALGDGAPRMLHITKHPGFASIFPADSASAQFLGFAKGMTVTSQVPIVTRRLDDCAEVLPVDFLKIDVEGSEFTVIANGSAKLADAVAIQTEVRFFPIYAGEPSYGELEGELTRQGFRFLRFAKLKSVSVSSHSAPRLLKRSEFAQVVDGDAFFIRDLRGVASWSDEAVKRLAILADAVIDSPDLALFALDVLVRRGLILSDVVEVYLSRVPAERRSRKALENG